MKKLPIGIQTFSEIRTCGYYYVDKTPLVAHMVDNGKYYFLSRPRRFGKSLLISTLADAFSGKKDLFQGLHLEDNWDWSRPSPVIRLDFAEGLIKSSHRLHERLNRILDLQAHRHQVDLRCPQPDDRLEELILALHQKTGNGLSYWSMNTTNQFWTVLLNLIWHLNSGTGCEISTRS